MYRKTQRFTILRDSDTANIGEERLKRPADRAPGLPEAQCLQDIDHPAREIGIGDRGDCLVVADGNL